ncbi:hypothetical protein DID88_010206 [Monilinia fructigena]|uniref:RNase MRP protein 1 RNA binding domain-containing protein n=1 Tax=Monilinia fructigena TaxID=38457 RepID=A0A395IL44_9HELO|nr:hypothetical protein DID88_010206 [Monilinia fructigena]
MNIPTPNPQHTQLVALTQLLHLTHHRNKNQHRLSKWYISFGILRRQVARLLSVVPEYVIESQSRGKVKGKARERKEKEERELQGLVKFVGEEVVPGCYLAFSQLVADNQYAREFEGINCRGNCREKAGAVKGTAKVDEPEVGEDLGEKIVRDAPVPGVTESNSNVEEVVKDDTEVKILKQKKRKPEGEGSDKKTSKLPSLDSTTAKPPKKKRKKEGWGCI